MRVKVYQFKPCDMARYVLIRVAGWMIVVVQTIRMFTKNFFFNISLNIKKIRTTTTVVLVVFH